MKCLVLPALLFALSGCEVNVKNPPDINVVKPPDVKYTRDRPGMSAFALEDGVVYHTYSAFSRGVDALWGMYPWLDRVPKGRNETGPWLRRHDEYESLPQTASSCCHATESQA